MAYSTNRPNKDPTFQKTVGECVFHKKIGKTQHLYKGNVCMLNNRHYLKYLNCPENKISYPVYIFCKEQYCYKSLHLFYLLTNKNGLQMLFRKLS